MTAPEKTYDLVIIGGGVTGTSIAYTACRFTNIPRLALLEHYAKPAEVNSNRINNAQTLHFGDIETNFSLEKARDMMASAKLLVAFLLRHCKEGETFRRLHKMALGVGKNEVGELRGRFLKFKPYFPDLRIIERDEIGRLEPRLVEGRNRKEEICALLSPHGYAVDYQKLAETFLSEAKKDAAKSEKTFDVYFSTRVLRITKENGHYAVHTDRHGIFRAKVIVCAAGPYSLLFAHRLGHPEATKYSLLPVAGNFYLAGKLLNGKVYAVQDPELPFARAHADPAVDNPMETRFGPTVEVLPLLERHHWWTFFDFWKLGLFTSRGMLSVFKITLRKKILKFVLKNAVYKIPGIGKWAFLKSAQKLIPTLRYQDLRYAKGAGGIRPQLVNTGTKRLEMGVAKFTGENIIFNVTPSPGASNCLGNAVADTRSVVKFLDEGFTFDEEKLRVELGIK